MTRNLRKIKFRGQKKFSGYTKKPFQWVYGDFYHAVGGVACIGEWEVVRATVGEYIGINDRAGTEIYEGDILEIQWAAEETWDVGVVEYWDAGFRFVMEGEGVAHDPKDWADIWNDPQECIPVVIGNIHEHPERLSDPVQPAKC